MNETANILFIDDDNDVRTAFSRVVAFNGLKVDLADGFESATSLAKKNRYAVVVTDYCMPDRDGLQVLDSMRKLQPDATYIVLSGHCDVDMAMRAVNKHKVFRILTKPLNVFELKEALEQGVTAHWDAIARQKVQANLAHATHEIAKHRQRVEEAWKAGQTQLSEAFLGAFAVRGHETVAHCRRLAAMARVLGQAAGITGEALQHIEHGALLHDLGMLAIPDSILLKAGPLSPDEWKTLRQHPDVGAELVTSVPFLRGAQQIIRQHHERWDGKGYPHGLAGEAISVGARVVSICDAMEAMLSGRAYREAAEVKMGVAQVVQMAGSQFDPRIAKVFGDISAQQWVDIRSQFPDPPKAPRTSG